MNNLKTQIKDEVISSPELSGAKCIAFDSDLNVIYCINGSNQVISLDVTNRALKVCGDVGVSGQTDPICIDFMSEERNVFIALTSGDIIVFNTLSETFETVGTLSDGLESVAFSLDQELIALVTLNKTLVLMNKLFDILAQKDLKTQEFGCNPSVSVNWGSKLTQFHGEGKRDVRTVKEEFKSFSDFDDHKSRISWRADGLYFVTSFFDETTNYRKLQIWSRDAVLQYTNEPINGLEHLISWKPSGSLIASSQLVPNKHLIVFVEKNGLKHGEFELPYGANNFKIDLILWSNDSQILLVCGTEKLTSNQILTLWRQTNYKWDLKQTLVLTSNRIVCVLWDPIDASLLHLLLSDGQYLRHRFKWSVDRSEGIVALIDGRSAKITNFERCVIPPPFFSYSIDFKAEIREIYYSNNRLGIVLVDDSVFLCSNNSDNSSESLPLTITYDNDESDDTHRCYYQGRCPQISNLTNVIFDDKTSRLYGIQSKQIYYFDYLNESKELVKLLDLDFTVLAVAIMDEVMAIVSEDCQLWKINLNNGTISEWLDSNVKPVRFAPQSSQLELVKINETIHAICLTENFTLCLDNEIIAQNNCNSFTIFNNRFLLFTTTDHFLHCWPINENIFKPNENYQDFKPRSVERGSKIVTATSDGKLVLQMPRGNLEAVYPRPLLLDWVMRKIDELEFALAFDLLRRHRINLNFIYDYKQILFRDNIRLFVEQIGAKSIDWICLFLNDLSNEDFYTKMCETNRPKAKFTLETSDQSLNKMDSVCDLMRETMNILDSTKYLNPILLTYIKKSVSETVNALKVIKAIEEPKIVDKCLKFLLYYIDINTLFDEALGSYDFALFLMVASKSQRDPKEYLSLVKEFNEIESLEYRYYQIDVHLKRYKKALTHIVECDEHFEECLKFVRQHSLYRDSIVLFANHNEDKQRMVWKLYAEYLFDKKYFEESAIAFRKSADFVNAVKAYHLSGNWNAAIESALKCPELINVETVARNAAKQLSLIGKHFEASYLLQFYANDRNESIRTLIDGHQWEHAFRLIDDKSDDNLYDYFKSELIKEFDCVYGLITNSCDVFVRQMNRLETVMKKQSERLTTNADNYVNFDDKSDIYSETNSVTESQRSATKSSSSSLQTRKVRKANKKSVSKKYILKEGSSDEDIQLIYAMKESIGKTDQMQEEVSLLVRTLYNFDYIDESKKIQNSFSRLLEVITQIIAEIWSENKTEESATKYRINDPELAKPPELRKLDWRLILV